MNALQLIIEVENINGNTFVSIPHYTNSKGEESKQVLQIGVNRNKRLQKDLETLKGFEVSKMDFEGKKYDLETALKAKDALIVSLEKVLAPKDVKEQLKAANDATINRSNGQIDAYETIVNGLRYNKEEKMLYVTGYVTFKQVLVKGEYKKVNSRPLTLAKNDIKKQANLLDSKFRNMRLDNIDAIKINGKLIQLK
jgi:hypothetical protein